MVCNYCPCKDNPYCVRLTIGGYNLPNPLDSGYPAETLLEAKIIFNIVISTPGYQFICVYIKGYSFFSPVECFEYVKLNFRWISKEIFLQYNLYYLVEPYGYVY